METYNIIFLIFIICGIVFLGVVLFTIEKEETEFKLQNLSCEQVRDMLIIEVYPKTIEIVYYYDWLIFGSYNETVYFSDSDFKEYYRKNCMEVKKDEHSTIK